MSVFSHTAHLYPIFDHQLIGRGFARHQSRIPVNSIELPAAETRRV